MKKENSKSVQRLDETAAERAEKIMKKIPEEIISKSNIFDSAFAKLNPAQRDAVQTIEGPLMVIAGPGTGKTQVISLRVANILRRTQMRPSNILCLTFSVSGATAMRERLRKLIGADAYAVTVSTIHGFCDSIITSNPSLFETWSAKKQISDLEKYRELNTIIDQISSHSELINKKDPYARTAAILQRISDCKREGKTLADLQKVAELFDTQMSGKSREGTKAQEKNLKSARVFRDFIAIFDLYQQMLTHTGRYDYDDMILFVLQMLEEEEWLRQSLQERYQYLLVDEAQDLNGAQWRVIEKLTTYPEVPHEPNLFLVGDDDQAIYRFQGANILNMLSFHERFPDAPVVALTVSYRSTQAILDAAEHLIEKNEERLVNRIPGLLKNLQAASSETGEQPELFRAASNTAEPWLIADLVEERISRGIEPQEIAVLTQTNAELFPLYDVLRARGIPVILYGKADLLTHSSVLQTLTIFEALLSLEHNSSLLAALACSCFACHPADLARISSAAREKKQSVSDVLLSLDDGDLKLYDSKAVLHARDVLFDLSNKLPSRTVLETTDHTLHECGLLSRDPIDLASTETFFHFVKQRCLEFPALTFHQFLSDLRLFADPLYSQVRLTFQVPHLVSEGVQLLTAHQSKGLEFHTVILSNFRDGHWDRRRTPPALSLPEDLLFGWDKEQKSFEKHQDERRVAFVAMTRAKRELLFTCPREVSVGSTIRPVSVSAFFTEAGSLPERDAALSNPEEASLLLLQPKRVLDEELKAYIRSRLETFALSATSLTRFLRDPEEFLMVDLLQQPEKFDEGAVRSLGFGNAVHWALREWGSARQRGEEFAVEKFLQAFEWYLTERTILTQSQRRDLQALGSDALPRYYSARLAEKTGFIYSVERGYTGNIGDMRIKGKIDRIDLDSATSRKARVIDYKSGKAKTEGEIRGGLEAGTISRLPEGDQFRQLAFYALLLEHSEPLLEPSSFSLEYIGERGENPVSREFSIQSLEKASLQRLIEDVWGKILALDFTPLT